MRRRKDWDAGLHQRTEPLEERVMMSLDSLADQALPTNGAPIDVATGLVNLDDFTDLVALTADGQVTVALNGGADRWGSVSTTDLHSLAAGSWTANGFALSLFNSDPFADLAVQAPDGVRVFVGDGAGSFSFATMLPALSSGDFALTAGGRVGLTATTVNSDFAADLIVASPQTNEVWLFAGHGDGSFDTPLRFGSGADAPIDVLVGRFVGDARPDIVVGHRDGSVTFLEGTGEGQFTLRPGLTVSGLGIIADLAGDDFDGDGEQDLVVSGTNRVTLLRNDEDVLTSSPIVNGDFALGLTGWTKEIVGHAAVDVPGVVNTLGGFAQLHENESFLTSLAQTFVVPPSPQSITVDLLTLGLEFPNGGIPDAFEISLLDAASHSLVSTIGLEATSFFNVNPASVVGGANQFTVASGVSFNGTMVTLDISGLTPGVSVTLFFDLIGNGPGNGSVVSFDNVRIAPEAVFANTFTATLLPGPFVGAAGLAQADVDGDGQTDVIVADRAANRYVVLNGDGTGSFTRQEIDVSSFGSEPLAVAVGRLTTNSIHDVAVTLFGSNAVLTPLTFDVTGPDVSLVSPANGSTVTVGVSQLDVQFTEAMRDNGSSGNHSVSNPLSYTLIGFGANGVFDNGASDDVSVPVIGVTFNGLTFVATLSLASPLADGGYRLCVEGTDATKALEDLAGNRLRDGLDADFTFTVNAVGPEVALIRGVSGAEGQEVSFEADITDAGSSIAPTTAIDWGDGSTSLGTVTFANGSGTVSGTHVYADNRAENYSITLTLNDSFGRTDSGTALALVVNDSPTVTAAGIQAVAVGSLLSLTVATFTDPGFTNVAAGTSETFTAMIDWGDGSSITSGTVTVTNGSAGVLTSGSVAGSHTFVAPGLFHVTVTVQDDDSGNESATFDVLVNNNAPMIESISSPGGNEGSAVSFSAAFTDAGELSSHTATIHWGDGVTTAGTVAFDDGLGTITGSHVYADNGAYSVLVSVTDGNGLMDSESTTTSIANVAPTATATGLGSLPLGAATTLTLAHFTDPGFTNVGAGTSESFSTLIDWGDGSAVESGSVTVTQGSDGVLTVGSVSGSHAYTASGTFTIQVTIADDDRGQSTVAQTIAVANLAPTVLSVSRPTGNENQAVSVIAAFQDLFDTSTHTAGIDWGDGSTSPGSVTFASGSGTVSGSHVYADNGVYSVTVTVSDAAGLTGGGSATATIGNVAPTLTPPASPVVVIGHTVSLTVGTFTDPGFSSLTAGTAETFTATIDWGDGASVSAASVSVVKGEPGIPTSGELAGSHTFAAAGNYLVHVTVTDDELGSDSATFTLRIEPPATTAKFFVVDQSFHTTFRYDSEFVTSGSWNLASGNSAPRGAEANPVGDTLWVVNASKDVFVYNMDGTTRGSWRATDLLQPEGIGTDGSHIWVVDDDLNRVFVYANAASRLSGSTTATASFALNSLNKKPSGLTTDGSRIWITDENGSTERVFVYSTAGTFLGRWNLDPANGDPSGVTRNPQTGDLYVVDRLDARVYRYATGTTRLSGSQLAANSYALDPANHNPEGIADPTSTITIGSLVSDSIGVAGEIDRFEFAASAGQSIYVDFQVWSGGLGTVTLLNPAGGTIFSSFNLSANSLDNGPLALTATGTYALQVTAAGTRTYQFKIWDVPAPDVVTTTLGVTNAGAIESPGRQDWWQFNGTSGQAVFVDWMSLTNGLDVTLVSPTGVTVYNVSGFALSNLDRNLTLSETGQFTLKVRGSGDRTATYSFGVFDTTPVVRTTSVGLTNSAMISGSGRPDDWFFTLATAETLYFDFQSGSGIMQSTLFSPTGSTLYTISNAATSNHDRGPVALAAGTYRLRVGASSGGTPSYSFKLWDVPPADVRSLAFEEIALGGVETPGRLDEWRFTATAGQQVFLDFQEYRGTTTEYVLISPSGTTVVDTLGNTFSNFDSGPTTLSQSGEYRIQVSGMRGTGGLVADGTASYRFRLFDATPGAAIPISLDTPISGVLDVPGRAVTYTFNGSAGQSITLDSIFSATNALGNPGIAYKLVSPSGATLFSNQTTDGVISLPAAGTYQLVVDDANGVSNGTGRDFAGSFSFRLSTAVTGLPVSADLIVSNVTAARRVFGNPAQVEVTWTVTNNGTAATDLASWRDLLRLSDDTTAQISLDWQVGSFEHSGTLAPGASYSRTETVTLPPGLSGDFSLTVIADGLNQVFENLAEANNTRAASQPTSLYLTPSAVTGDPALSLDLDDQQRFPTGTTLALSGNAQALPGSMNVVFVVDVSGSTAFVTNLDANFDGLLDAQDDLNGDGRIGDILDTEIGAVLRTVQQLGNQPHEVNIAIVPFGSGAEPLDLSYAAFAQSFSNPFADLTTDGTPDLEQAVRSLTMVDNVLNTSHAELFRAFSFPAATNFQAAVQAVNRLFDGAQTTDRNHLFFLTDGEATTEPTDAEIAQLAARGLDFTALQITGSAVSASLNRLATGIDAAADSTGLALLVTDPEQLAERLTAALSITSVTVNGQPVDMLDPTGNFFSSVMLVSGPNTFVVTSQDGNGRATTQTLTLIGVDPTSGLDFAALESVTPLASLTYQTTTFNRQTRTLHTDATLTALGAGLPTPPLSSPIVAVFDAIAPAAVALSNAEGTTPVVQAASLQPARPYVVFDSEFPTAGLAPGATSTAIPLSFENLDRHRFSVATSLHGPANSAPVFTTVPVTQASVGATYQYDANVFDAEGDALTLTLTSAPAGLTLSTLITGGEGQGDRAVLLWTPTALQLGNHVVELVVSDGHGGTATQRWTVNVFSPAPNLPPAILSTPSLIATVGVPYSYDVNARDPEGAAVTYAFATAPAGATINPTTGLINWPNPSPSSLIPYPSSSITVRVTDAQGNAAEQSWMLDVRQPNTPPTITSTPIITITGGTVLIDRITATDTEDAVTFSIVTAPATPSASNGGFRINPHSGIVSWPTTLADLGTHTIVLRATDERGLFTDQPYTLTVTADSEAPVVSILLSDSLLHIGDTLTITVLVTDNVAVATRSLTINGQPVALDANGQATFTTTTASLPVFVANATDSSGNVDSTTIRARFIDPNDTTGPIGSIESLANGSIVTYLTDLIGTVSAPDLEFYRLDYALAGTDDWHEFASGTTEVSNALLGTFDPTMLARDIYDIRLVAQDFSGNLQVSPNIQLHVEGQAILGNFHLEFTDLNIPLAGIPITVTRVYDTLDANHSGDFGYGWSLAFAEPHIRETIRLNPNESLIGDLFGSNPFRTGTRVYLTNPDGRRVGFTFDPTPAPGFLGTIWHPHFVADPGVFDTLTVEDALLSQNPDGTFGLFLFGFNYNPADYRLTTKAGVTYQINQFDGLQTIRDRNGNTLTFSDSGIVSSAGPSIQFQRDALGRITQIIDPSGNPLIYSYDARGDLVSFTDQATNESTFEYLSNPAHYLSQIVDPLGNPVVRTEYDAQGRLIGSTDALGNPTTQSYDLLNNTEFVGDRLGNETRLVYDDRGNIVQVTDPLGATTTLVYDVADNVISTTNSRGFTTTAIYDSRGNLTSSTDPLGNTRTLSFNAFNQLVTAVDPLGRALSFTYDSAGNLTQWTDPSGAAIAMTFDCQGRPTSLTDQAGNVTTVFYGSGALPTRMENPDGTVKQWQYNALGLPSRIIDENGQETLLSYDATGRTLAVRDAEGFVATLQYVGQFLASATDRLGRVTRYEYDDAGRRVREIDPLGGITEFAYDANGQMTAETDPHGHTTHYVYRADGRLASVTINPTTSYDYDPAGNIIAVTDRNGRITRYEYDALNRQTRMINALGGIQSFGYDAVGNLTSWTDENGHTASYAYNSINRLSSETDALNGEWSYAYDSRGNLRSETDANDHQTQYEYDTRNRLAQTIDSAGSVWHYQHDGVGNLLSWTDPLGRTTNYGFDGLNRLVETRDALGGITTNAYDAMGNTTSYRDALGRTTTATYDDLDRRVAITDPLGGLTQFTYDDTGNLLTLTDLLGRTTTRVYDHLDRVIQTIDPLGGTNSFTYDAMDNLMLATDALGRTTGYAYDALDRITSRTDVIGAVTRFSYDSVGNLLGVTDPLGQQHTNAYDPLNRVVTSTDALGATTSYAHDAIGNLTSLTDPLGRVTTYGLDILDRVVSTTDPRAGVTQFAYDAVSNLTALTDPLGQTSQFAYDDLNRLTAERNPLGSSRTYEYDAVSNLIGSTDRNGRLRSFAYDALDRRVAETWWDGAADVRTLSFSFDAVGNLLTSSDPDSHYTLTYDALDRLREVDNAATPQVPRVVLSYTYDAVSNLLSTSDNLNVRVTSGYDAVDRLVSRTWSGSGVAPARVEFDYNLRGDRTETRRFADVAGTESIGRSTYGYDAVGRVTDIQHLDAVDAVFADYDYLFDLAGQLQSESHHGQTTNYTQDATGQLTSADHSSQTGESYTYDANGNRVTNGYVVGPNNQIQSDGTFNYEYDAEGNLVLRTRIASNSTTRYEYDHRNRLTSVEDHDASGNVVQRVEFTYDIFDRRIAKTVDADGSGPQIAITTSTVYDGIHAWADFDALGTVTARYLFGDQIDELLARFRPGEGTAWYLPDHLGTVRDIVDTSGALMDHIDYDTFGNVVLETSTSYGDRFKFTGREYDAETGLYYYRARYYDPNLGRFTSEDPLGFLAGDTNLSRYVNNAPLIATDPSGLSALTENTLLRYGIAGAAIGAIVQFVCGQAHPDQDPWEQAQEVATAAAVGGVFGLFLPLLAELAAVSVEAEGVLSAVQAAGIVTAEAQIFIYAIKLDQGTFSRVDAECLGVTMFASVFIPALSPRNPAWPSVPLRPTRPQPNRPVASAPVAPRGAARTNAQLVQDVAKRAEGWGKRQGLASTGSVEGTLKHGYADRLLTRYQRMYGDRGLSTEVRYVNGRPWTSGDPLKGSIRLDVVEGSIANPSAIFDYKFGNAILSPNRINQIRRGAGLGPTVPVTGVFR